MEKRLLKAAAKWGMNLWLAFAMVTAFATPGATAQTENPLTADAARKPKVHMLPDKLPDHPTIPPTLVLPVDPLGFSPPGAIYMGQRVAQVSLDFLDENRLLFTFRVPGLIHRQQNDSDERQIRALVLALPAGNIEADALWTVHDHGRYLWNLSNGQFLLRNGNVLSVGERNLETKPFLKFPGPLVWLEMDPEQQYLVTNSREPAAGSQTPGTLADSSTAAASVTADGQKESDTPDLVVRILRRTSGEVMLVSRIRTPIHLPINSDGYLEGLRGNGAEWVMNLSHFRGGSTIVGKLDSACSPSFDFLSAHTVLASTCASSGARDLVGFSLDGRRLWDDMSPSVPVWPHLIVAQNGSRLVRETLAVNHSVTASAPLDADDIKGQLVQVLDAADGQLVLALTANPVFDAGGNVAISPSGKRLAVLTGGTIQVFDMPAPAAIPEVPEGHAAR